ncbi:MAG: hypothetical protein M9926_07870 [Lentimicrobium sp.]|uniref:hypothetical protein n=1 Tax=Lentimicrobium sp. TaxID=2034841 RepID=UPI0025EE7239|nr:hypothetical protein [Lentimicrobium sp.]MCO5256664.1 hypothetical protein [Lentimicrobium sp.]
MLAWNSTNNFGIPSGNYLPGQSIPGGGTVLYEGTLTDFEHSGLEPATTYYYAYGRRIPAIIQLFREKPMPQHPVEYWIYLSVNPLAVLPFQTAGASRIQGPVLTTGHFLRRTWQPELSRAKQNVTGREEAVRPAL